MARLKDLPVTRFPELLLVVEEKGVVIRYITKVGSQKEIVVSRFPNLRIYFKQ